MPSEIKVRYYTVIHVFVCVEVMLSSAGYKLDVYKDVPVLRLSRVTSEANFTQTSQLNATNYTFNDTLDLFTPD